MNARSRKKAAEKLQRRLIRRPRAADKFGTYGWLPPGALPPPGRVNFNAHWMEAIEKP